MRQATIQHPTDLLPGSSHKDIRVAKILARTIFKDMESSGVPNEQVLEVASELIRLVTEHLKERPGPVAAK